jgi:hypothetical protein
VEPGAIASRLGFVEVKLGKPMLEDVGETEIRAAWGGQVAPPPGMPASGEYQREWLDIGVYVALEPRPDRSWLLLWQEEEFDSPDGPLEPLIDGGTLYFSAPEEELQAVWEAIKARVAATNALYRGECFPDEDEAERHGALDANLRERAQRRVDELT